MNNKNKSIKLIQTGAESFEAAISGAIGLIGGPLGAIGGSVAGVIISKGISELADRFLLNREQVRVGAAAGWTLIGVQEKLDREEIWRQDVFLSATI